MGLDPDAPALTVWAVSDGRPGNENPALGVAEAVARLRPSTITVKRVAWTPPFGRFPSQLQPRAALKPESGIEPPWPDLWIAAGRASVALSMGMRRWSQGKTFVVQLQDPRVSSSAFDLVVAPRHDGTRGENVVAITGSPHRVRPERLAAELARFEAELSALPRPRAAVLIGGKSKAFDLPPDRAKALGDQVAQAVEAAGGSVTVTFSRRTPEAARAILAERLGALPGTIWSGEGDNPYFAFLAAADAILVTEDSANMATEAAATGTPVYRLDLVGRSPKFARLHEDLERLGAERPFAGRLETWAYTPLAETDRAAEAILARMATSSRP